MSNTSEQKDNYGAIQKICCTCRGKYWADTKFYINGWYNHFHCASCCYTKIEQRRREEYMKQFDEQDFMSAL
jgi:hypothetical protein